MNFESKIFSGQNKTPLEDRNWVLVLLIVLSAISGVSVTFIGAKLGWAGLLIAPFIIGSLAVLIWPVLGYAVFVFIIYIQLSYVINNYHSGIPSPGQPLLAVLLFLILWRIVVYGERPFGWKRASVIFILIGYWLMSVFFAGNYENAISTFQKFVENTILAFVVVFFLRDQRALKLTVWVLLLAGVFMSIISVFQTFTSTFDNFYWGYGGWVEASTGGTSNHRVAGPYGNPNAYSQVLVVLVPLAFDRLWHEKNSVGRFFAGIALFLCTLSVFFTYSRNGFVTLFLTISFLIATRRPNITVFVFMGVFAMLMLQFLPSSYIERLSTLFQFSGGSTSRVADESFRGRISENVAAWRMFLDNPVFGVGLNNFQLNYQKYSRQIGLDSRRDERSPASFYLELLSEQGIIGTAIFTAFMIFVFRGLWNAYKKFNYLGYNDFGNLTISFIAGLIGYMVFYISKNSSYPNVFWLLIGVALSIPQVADDQFLYLKKSFSKRVFNEN